MMHKIGKTMGRRDSKYLLGGQVEVDEGFFETRMWFPSTLFEDYSFKILNTSFCPLAVITSIDEMRRLS
jgi:hypothetical protein